MKVPFRRPLPVEQPLGPVRGYKLAYPMLAGEGQMAGFKGVWSSIQQVYRVRDTATCFWNRHHAPPQRRCGCGFYCLNSVDAARAMSCEGQYRSTVILEVEVSGRFIRYEEGFRYSDQRVLAVHLHRCLCGRPASALVDSGTGLSGWLQLRPCCFQCIGPKEPISPARFGALLGDPALVMAPAASLDGERGDIPNVPAVAADDAGLSLSVLTAEIALLQARVDSLQEQVSRLSD